MLKQNLARIVHPVSKNENLSDFLVRFKKERNKMQIIRNESKNKYIKPLHNSYSLFFFALSILVKSSYNVY